MSAPSNAARGGAVTYQLDFLPQTRHAESTRYPIVVLWLIGLGSSSIAKLMLIPRSSVASIIARSEYADRSTMTDRQRQTLLDELREIRFEDGRPLDGGRLDAITWQIQPLSPAKVRPDRRSS